MRIADFIRGHPALAELDFPTVYLTIITLIEEGYIAQNVD